MGPHGLGDEIVQVMKLTQFWIYIYIYIYIYIARSGDTLGR